MIDPMTRLSDAAGALADKLGAENRNLLAQVCVNPKAEIALRRELAKRGLSGEAIARILSGELSHTDLPVLMPALLGATVRNN